MKIAVAGGGPAGLYCSLLLAQAGPRHEITVFERNPRGATYGWGVVFSDRTLASFREADRETYEAITESFVSWDAIDIRIRDTTVRCGGQPFAGIARLALLEILAARCERLGVDLRFETELDPAAAGEFDLVVAGDGVHSRFRKDRAEKYGVKLAAGRAKYIWFGTTMPLDSFLFAFKDTDHGVFQAHAYPFDGERSTFIVECARETWANAGLAGADENASIAFCEELFAPELRGHPLMSNASRWIEFITVTNRRWSSDGVVLLGDSAHTAHFSIGSGTKLAMEDAIALAEAISRRSGLEDAIAEYEMDRKPRVVRFQEAARRSQSYFENTARYIHLEPLQFAAHLLTRSGRRSYDDLRVRDPRLVDRIERWFAHAAGPLSPPPAFTPIELRGLRLPNRMVAGLRFDTTAATRSGAAAIMTEIVAVAPDARITPECRVVEDEARLEEAFAPARERGLAVALQIGHAGARGSCRPRRKGLDRPLPSGNWPLVAATATPFAPGGRIPRAAAPEDRARIRDEFAAAAAAAARTGADLLVVNMAHGYLLGGFLSPLTNPVPLAERLSFPVDVFAGVRRAWPDRPLGVVLNGADWAPGGAGPSDAVAAASALREAGCDLVAVTAGQALATSRPRYDSYWITSYADRIRNEAGVPTLSLYPMTTTGDVNGLVASGRTDLSLFDSGTA